MTQYVKPKKHLGQHFLTDRNIAFKIVDSLPDTNNILEIGPGKGILTGYILQIPDVIYKCIEIDSESVEYLMNNSLVDSEMIILGDFLKTDISVLFNGSFSIIGNFPYNISSQILFKVLENRYCVDYLVGMFQKEVAERIVASPGSKVYGILSVLMQSYYDVEILFTVSESVFQPPPKVKSSVIRMKRKPEELIPQLPDDFLRKLVKTAFSQRRKMLRNTLAPYGIAKIQQVHQWMTKRPEQLSISEFHELARFLQQK
jgi:16S rRNA (adenine1518-N6/adenine1519-N6)-dimethyltransferase